MDPFRIRDHVADFDRLMAQLGERSRVARATLKMEADVAYGSGIGETLDLFFPRHQAERMPVHMFVHGGYWRSLSKREFSFVAETVTAAGAIAAIVDYALMPAVRMATLVAQIARARRFLSDNAGFLGGDPARITVSGHSAGAHLCTFLLEERDLPHRLRGALLLSGLYDLDPVRASFLQAELGLTEEEVAQFSPMTRRHDPGIPVTIAVGAAETTPFLTQAERFAAGLAQAGGSVSRQVLPDGSHLSVVLDLGTAGSAAATLLAETIGHSP